MNLGLSKKQKLCSTVAIDTLFGHGDGVEAALAFPVRAVWRENVERRSDAPLQFLVSIPKKRLRHAVDRVKMRRRIREAFRLHWQDYPWPKERKWDLAFVYVDSSLQSYDKVERAVKKLLQCVWQSGS